MYTFGGIVLFVVIAFVVLKQKGLITEYDAAQSEFLERIGRQVIRDGGRFDASKPCGKAFCEWPGCFDGTDCTSDGMTPPS